MISLDIRIILVIILTFIITLIGTLAYSVRLVGVRTGKIAISFALFNVLALVSRTANTIQVPLLTNFVEKNEGNEVIRYFHMIIISAGIATILGAILIPTFQRILSKAVMRFSIDRSIPQIIIHGFSRAGVKQFKTCIGMPATETIKEIKINTLPKKIIIFNIIAVALLVVGSLGPIYAGIIEPSLRATCLSLSGIINGFASILLFIFIDPFLSVKTDDVVEGKCSHTDFRKCVIGMVGAKVAGTFFALLLLVPAAKVIVRIAVLL